MRGVLALSCGAVAAAASREVHKLRAAQSACTLNFTRGPEPTKRFVVLDLIDASPKSTAAWAKVLYHLGAWPRVDVERVKRLRRAEAKGAGLVTSFRNAHAPQIMIHGSKPISATIGNYNAVYRVLKGTPHEWMLERHLEPKSSR